MSKRDYTHVKELLPQILEMREQGKTHQAIADHFQLKNKDVVKGLLKRQSREMKKEESSKFPKKRGRKPAVTLQEYKYECKRLRIENELLHHRHFLRSRDFLELAGRR